MWREERVEMEGREKVEESDASGVGFALMPLWILFVFCATYTGF